MGLEETIVKAKSNGFAWVGVDLAALAALAAERDALKAENGRFKALLKKSNEDRDAFGVEVGRLKAENDLTEAHFGSMKAEIVSLRASLKKANEDRDGLEARNQRLKAVPAPSGHSCSDRAIVNDRLDALEAAIKPLQSRDILADQRMDHLDQLGRRVLALEEALESSE